MITSELSHFAKRAGLLKLRELDKVCVLAFYELRSSGAQEFTTKQVCEWFSMLHLPEPNTSRLLRNIRASRTFVKGSTSGSFRLHADTIERLSEDLAPVLERSEEVTSPEHVLPVGLFQGTPAFIESLARQINASYEHNIFDGCAVLMRRLLEVLLILSYQYRGIDSDIQDGGGNYAMLERIIVNARSNSTLKLSRNSKRSLDDFRTVGNFSAHKIYYTARRQDIRRLILEYRALIEELLYKAGIRV